MDMVIYDEDTIARNEAQHAIDVENAIEDAIAKETVCSCGAVNPQTYTPKVTRVPCGACHQGSGATEDIHDPRGCYTSDPEGCSFCGIA